MEEIFLKSLRAFDLPNWSSVPVAKSSRASPFQPRRLDSQSGLRSAWTISVFSAIGGFGELRMMLYAVCLEIYCCLSVAEIGIVACSSRTDVASRKEMTVSHPNDERFYWLK